MVRVWRLTRYWVLMLMVVTRLPVGVAVCVGDRRDVIDTPEVMPTTRRGIHDYRSVVHGKGGGDHYGCHFQIGLHSTPPIHPSSALPPKQHLRRDFTALLPQTATPPPSTNATTTTLYLYFQNKSKKWYMFNCPYIEKVG